MDEQEFKIKGFDMISKEVGPGGDSGRVFVPKRWMGKKVVVILKEEC